MIKLIEPKLQKCLKTREEHTLLMALLDLDVRSDDELSCLCADYRDILARRNTIMEQQKLDPVELDRISGLLTDFYIDRFKLKGVNVKEKLKKTHQSAERLRF